MSVKLQAPYGKYPIKAIVSFDAATEAALIAQGQATANLTGGVVWTEPADVSEYPVMYGSDGVMRAGPPAGGGGNLGAPVSEGGNPASIGIVGDSILTTGSVVGALVSMGTAIPGVNAFAASLEWTTGTTGTLECRAADRALRWTAPGDTAGPWTVYPTSRRARIASGTAALWLEMSVFVDLFGASDVSSTLTLSPIPAYTATLWRYMPGWIEIFSGQRLSILDACAPGATVAHLPALVADLRARATAAGARLTEVWMQAGTNDVASGAAPAVATMLEKLGEAIALAKGYGWAVRVFSVPMRTLAAGSAAQAGWRDYNRALPSACAAAGATYHDVWSHFIDPASAIAPAAGMTNDAAIHPSGTGAFIAAVRLWNEANGAWTMGRSPLAACSPIDVYNASTNPAGNLIPPYPVGSSGTSGNAGGVNTDLATGWQVLRDGAATAIVVTATKAPDPAGGQPWQRYTVSASPGVTEFARSEYNLGTGTTAVAPGDVIEAFAEVSVPAQAGLRRFAIKLLQTGAARNDSALFENFDTGATYAALPAVAWPGTPVIRLPRIRMAPGATGMRWQMFFGADASTTPLIDVRRLLWRKV